MRRLLLISLCLTGCASPRVTSAPPAPSEDPILAAIGLGGDDQFEHHLEQHPDTDCRADWRPSDLRLTYRREAPTPAAVQSAALRYEGVPYVYGGTGPDGLDCSALINRVFAGFGYDLPRTAREQYRVGLRIERQSLRAGDLVFFHEHPGGTRIGHVALYLGHGRFIHAVRGKGEVSFDRLSTRYYHQRFAGGRRLLVMPPGRYSDRSGAAKPDLAFDDAAQVAERFADRVGPCRESSFGRLASGG